MNPNYKEKIKAEYRNLLAAKYHHDRVNLFCPPLDPDKAACSAAAEAAAKAVLDFEILYPEVDLWDVN